MCLDSLYGEGSNLHGPECAPNSVIDYPSRKLLFNGAHLDHNPFPFLTMAATYTGSCKCSTIKIEMQGEPDMLGLCHCTNCRKSTGSTYSTNAIFDKSKFTIISGEPKVYEVQGGSGNPAFVNFCGNCGSTMWTKSPLRPDIVVIKVGILDGDALEKMAPKLETFTSRKPSWMKSVDGAMQFENGFVAPPS
ncbi:hypothetical protein V492_02093 [Pseudogymnoascus sp. VKM F-4246]|nr:hypothetical protein V492_02093 [Pseudogymnoascus sp. VKM F-4246]